MRFLRLPCRYIIYGLYISALLLVDGITLVFIYKRQVKACHCAIRCYLETNLIYLTFKKLKKYFSSNTLFLVPYNYHARGGRQLLDNKMQFSILYVFWIH